MSIARSTRYVAEKQLLVSAYDLEKLTKEMMDELLRFVRWKR